MERKSVECEQAWQSKRDMQLNISINRVSFYTFAEQKKKNTDISSHISQSIL